jgi:hypothetical protein
MTKPRIHLQDKRWTVVMGAHLKSRKRDTDYLVKIVTAVKAALAKE